MGETPTMGVVIAEPVLNSSGDCCSVGAVFCELVGVSLLKGELNSPSNSERIALEDNCTPHSITLGLNSLEGGVLNTMALVAVVLEEASLFLTIE